MGILFSTSTSACDRKLIDRQKSLESLPSELLLPLTQEEQKYLDASVKDIVTNVKTQKWTSEAVTVAHIKSALSAHQQTNCITEERFRLAIEEAKQRDARVKELGDKASSVLGSLWGIPASVKDSYDVKGLDTTIGMTRWACVPAEQDAVLPKLIQDAGAVIICKTNVPQTLMTFECRNPIFGATTNPYSKDHTCGGSSGGEGAILALKGSKIGIGSDIGGSLRIPAHYCGIYSLKPSSHRFPIMGHVNPNPGFLSIGVSSGPMNQSVEDLEIVTRTVLNSHPEKYDFTVVPIPFDETKMNLPNKLKFAYFLNDGFVRASPAAQRGVKIAVAKLKEAGHDVIEIEPPDFTEAATIFSALVTADGWKTVHDLVHPDQIDSSLRLQSFAPNHPYLSALLAWVVETFLGDSKFPKIVRASNLKSARELQEWNHRKDCLVKTWYDLKSNIGFDALIAPVQALPALPHDSVTNISLVVIETAIFNMIDWTAGVVPVTKVDKSLDVLTSEWRSQLGGEKFGFVERFIYGGKKAVYDPEKMHGLPIGVQVIGGRFEEEKVIAMMKVVDDLVNGTK